MSLGKSLTSVEKRKAFAKRSLALASTNSQDSNFLTIERAFPRVDKKVVKRSNSALGTALARSKDVFGSTETIALQTSSDGGVHICRSEKEKQKNPDRICLDRRGLVRLPMLNDEPDLRLLSLQHNLVNSLDGFRDQAFPQLVFLDVYNNQLETIRCLEQLGNLRVLLMGKNRIKHLEGLEKLTKVEVLDLHGNRLAHIGGLSNMKSLKVLNLAGNQLTAIGTGDLKGLDKLEEFNLKRNRLTKLLGFTDTPNLQKLNLSNNELQKLENIYSLTKVIQMQEIFIENNPISLAGDCVSFLVSYLPKLSLLNGMQVTEQVRKAAIVWRRNKESSDSSFMNLGTDVNFDLRREQVISNARTNWELIRSQTKYLTTGSNSVYSSKQVGKLARIGQRIPVLPAKKIVLGRTQSQDTEYTSSSNTVSSGEFFRLPPILIPIINRSNSCFKRSESASSIGPNIDSSFSSFVSNSSDSCSSSSESNDEEEKKPEEEETLIESKDSIAVTLNHVQPEEVSVETKESNPTAGSTTNVSESSDSKTIPKPKLFKSNSYSNRNVKSATPVQRPQKIRARSLTAKPRKQLFNASSVDNDREQGGDYLIEICGRHLNVIGQGALRFVDKQWSMSKAKDVTTVNFQCASFNNIVGVLGRLKQRFPGADSFTFKETNVQFLGQLNALAEVQGIGALCIHAEGNPIVHKNWESYAIYRLAHWGLRFVNGREISEVDIKTANEQYQSLSDIVLWTLPDYLLQPLLLRLQLGVGHKIKEKSAKKWLLSADTALRNVVIKEALQWKKGGPNQEDLITRQKAKVSIGEMIRETCNAVGKLRKLDEIWPEVLQETVRNILVDFSDMNAYRKKKIEEINL